MKNPYPDQDDSSPSQIILSPKLTRTLIGLIASLLLVIPIARHIWEAQQPIEERWLPLRELFRHPNQKSYNLLFAKRDTDPTIDRDTPNLSDHFRSFEKGLEDGPMQRSIRQSLQATKTQSLREGNRKVIIGSSGRLYYRPAVTSLTGPGPLSQRALSVAADPAETNWRPPLPIIEEFAAQLNERGIELMIVPIPVKPMLEPEGLGLHQALRHPDQDRFYDRLREMGITVIDLAPTFLEAKTGGTSLYLDQDTHWRADVAKLAAQEIAQTVKSRDWYATSPKNLPPLQRSTVQRSAWGDLVDMLALQSSDRERLFTPEHQQLELIHDASTGMAVEGDLSAPVTLLGDSFVNIYEEPGLGFADEAQPGLVGAGFGSHLTAELEQRIHSIAINGGGASDVRKAFAMLPDDVVRSKKLVIWAIAARDFLLSRSDAIAAKVHWTPVTFNEEPMAIHPAESPQPTKETSADDQLIVTAKLLKKSAFPGDFTGPALCSAIFGETQVKAGEYYDSDIYVFFLQNTNKLRQTYSELETGQLYHLKLRSLFDVDNLEDTPIFNDHERFDIDPFLVESIEF